MDIVVNGVTYNGVETVAMKDTSGRTVMFYPRMTITVTGTGSSGVCYLKINGNEVTTSGTYIVNAGDTIECSVASLAGSGSYATIILNGTRVLSKASGGGVGTYSYVVSKNASIRLAVYSFSSQCGRITITEED